MSAATHASPPPSFASAVPRGGPRRGRRGPRRRWKPGHNDFTVTRSSRDGVISQHSFVQAHLHPGLKLPRRRLVVPRAASASSRQHQQHRRQHPHAERGDERREQHAREHARERERSDALGGQDFIYSQKSGVEETLFKGSVLGVDADAATGDMRVSELRNFGNIVGDFHVPERFLDRFTTHVAKNMAGTCSRPSGCGGENVGTGSFDRSGSNSLRKT